MRVDQGGGGGEKTPYTKMNHLISTRFNFFRRPLMLLINWLLLPYTLTFKLFFLLRSLECHKFFEIQKEILFRMEKTRNFILKFIFSYGRLQFCIATHLLRQLDSACLHQQLQNCIFHIAHTNTQHMKFLIRILSMSEHFNGIPFVA